MPQPLLSSAIPDRSWESMGLDPFEVRILGPVVGEGPGSMVPVVEGRPVQVLQQVLGPQEEVLQVPEPVLVLVLVPGRVERIEAGTAGTLAVEPERTAGQAWCTPVEEQHSMAVAAAHIRPAHTEG